MSGFIKDLHCRISQLQNLHSFNLAASLHFCISEMKISRLKMVLKLFCCSNIYHLFLAPEAPNVTVTNISSTSLYVNWTLLPNSTSFYKELKGYFIEYWKESDEDNLYNVTQFKNDILFENLEKWTVYCFNVTAFTYGYSETSETQCVRTFEDGMIH